MDGPAGWGRLIALLVAAGGIGGAGAVARGDGGPGSPPAVATKAEATTGKAVLIGLLAEARDHAEAIAAAIKRQRADGDLPDAHDERDIEDQYALVAASLNRAGATLKAGLYCGKDAGADRPALAALDAGLRHLSDPANMAYRLRHREPPRFAPTSFGPAIAGIGAVVAGPLIEQLGSLAKSKLDSWSTDEAETRKALAGQIDAVRVRRWDEVPEPAPRPARRAEPSRPQATPSPLPCPA